MARRRGAPFGRSRAKGKFVFAALIAGTVSIANVATEAGAAPLPSASNSVAGSWDGSIGAPLANTNRRAAIQPGGAITIAANSTASVPNAMCRARVVADGSSGMDGYTRLIGSDVPGGQGAEVAATFQVMGGQEITSRRSRGGQSNNRGGNGLAGWGGNGGEASAVYITSGNVLGAANRRLAIVAGGGGGGGGATGGGPGSDTGAGGNAVPQSAFIGGTDYNAADAQAGVPNALGQLNNNGSNPTDGQPFGGNGQNGTSSGGGSPGGGARSGSAGGAGGTGGNAAGSAGTSIPTTDPGVALGSTGGQGGASDATIGSGASPGGGGGGGYRGGGGGAGGSSGFAEGANGGGGGAGSSFIENSPRLVQTPVHEIAGDLEQRPTIGLSTDGWRVSNPAVGPPEDWNLVTAPDPRVSYFPCNYDIGVNKTVTASPNTQQLNWDLDVANEGPDPMGTNVTVVNNGTVPNNVDTVVISDSVLSTWAFQPGAGEAAAPAGSAYYVTGNGPGGALPANCKGTPHPNAGSTVGGGAGNPAVPAAAVQFPITCWAIASPIAANNPVGYPGAAYAPTTSSVPLHVVALTGAGAQTGTRCLINFAEIDGDRTRASAAFTSGRAGAGATLASSTIAADTETSNFGIADREACNNPVPSPLAGADYATVDAWYADNSPASSGTDVDVTMDLTANDSDPLGGTLTATPLSATSANGGTVAANADGTVTYTPKQGFCGSDSFQYTLTATDPDPAAPPVIPTRTATGTATITVLCNNPPVAVQDTFFTGQGTTLNATVAANDLDFEDPKAGLTYSVVTPPAHATSFTLNADGTFTYVHDGTPTPVTDTFTYKVCDNHATQQPPSNPATLPRCATATATINLTPAPQAAPIAVADAAGVEAWYSSSFQTQTSVDIDVAGNDSDPDNNLDPSTVSVVTGPTAAQGTLVNNGDGTLTFSPADGFSGPVTVVYKVCDDPATATPPASTSLCANAVVLITVYGNLAPIAIDDTVTVAQDSGATVIPVIANDFDPSSDGLILGSAQNPSANGGTVVLNGDGTVSYTPAAGFSGTDTFLYGVCDDHLAAVDSTAVNGGDPWIRCAVAKVTVTVTATPNTPPIAMDDTAMTTQDTAVTVDVLGNDTDVEDDASSTPLTVTSVATTSSNGGTIVDNGDGTVKYTPAPGFCGLDTFAYNIADSDGATASATVSVMVKCDGPPVAEDDSGTTTFNTAVTIPYISNDTDPEDGTPTLKSVEATSTQGGTVTDAGSGKFTYVPKTGFCGLDSFDYTVVDSHGQTSTATVTVQVACGDQDTDGDGIPDWVEIVICGTSTCATGNEDTDGNGVPDWTEIILCGKAGCVQPGSTAADSDNDGIPDWVELIVCGTKTCATGHEDTDGDGIPDWVEVVMCGTTTCATSKTDSDGDGIPDWVEIVICGTKTCATGKEDTDKDGIPDWIEVIACGTVTCANPKTDTDGDGIPDWIEITVCGTKTCLDHNADTDGDGIPDWIEVQICGTATCATGKEDTDGNGIPDWQEIAICGKAGCMAEYARKKSVGACSNTGTFTIPGKLEYQIPNGFRSNTEIKVYMFSDPVLLYSGVLPDSGKVTLDIPSGTTPGKHKFMVIGVDDVTGAVKVDGCYKNSGSGTTQVAGTQQSPAATSTARAATPASRTGSNSGFLAGFAGAVTLLGFALVLVARRRRDEEA